MTNVHLELIEYYASCFFNSFEIWTLQAGNGTGRYFYYTPDKSYYKKLTVEDVAAHLSGDLTLGLVANVGGQSRFCAWDEDNLDGRLALIKQHLDSLDISSLHVTGRAGRSGHLFVLFTQPVPCVDLLLFRDEVESSLSIGRDHLEFFPKDPDRLSGIRAPLGINRKAEAGWSFSAPASKIDEVTGWFSECIEHNVIAQLEWLRRQRLNYAQLLEPVIADQRRRYERKRQIEAAYNRYSVKPTPKGPRLTLLEMIDILKWPYRRRGSQLTMRCPLCARMGDDTAGDNLMISARDGKFCCFEGGQWGKHTAKALIAHLNEAVSRNKYTR